MTLIEKRDAILESLRAQVIAKVREICVYDRIKATTTAYAISATHGIPEAVHALLLDIANNIAQGLADDEPGSEDLKGITSW
jgi:hypothetical protein